MYMYMYYGPSTCMWQPPPDKGHLYGFQCAVYCTSVIQPPPILHVASYPVRLSTRLHVIAAIKCWTKGDHIIGVLEDVMPSVCIARAWCLCICCTCMYNSSYMYLEVKLLVVGDDGIGLLSELLLLSSLEDQVLPWSRQCRLAALEGKFYGEES